MRFVKGIGLFFIYPLVMLAIGFYVGNAAAQERNRADREFYASLEQGTPNEGNGERNGDAETDSTRGDPTGADRNGQGAEDGINAGSQLKDSEPVRTVNSGSETLFVGTEYVLEETDVLHHTVVETVWELPDKYVGMNREQFLAAMDTYAAAPPLKELERGFVGLEVLSFARARVVVRMNYRYVQPTESFYLAAYDNYVTVFLEDRKTVYIETEIALDSLPVSVQQQIMRMMWVENEEELYDFLETYSS